MEEVHRVLPALIGPAYQLSDRTVANGTVNLNETGRPRAVSCEVRNVRWCRPRASGNSDEMMNANNEMTTATKRKYKSPRQLQRQSKILATVRSMLEEGGYEGMTIRDLARRAGVSVGTLYNLYGRKDVLVLAAVDDLLSRLPGIAATEAASEGFDGIFAFGRIIGDQIEATPGYADAMTRILFHVGSDDPLVEVLFARSYPFFKSQLEVARTNGDVRPEVDVDLVARHLVGQLWGVVLLWMMGMIPLGDNGRERQRSELMTLMGIATDSARMRLKAKLAALG